VVKRYSKFSNRGFPGGIKYSSPHSRNRAQGEQKLREKIPLSKFPQIFVDLELHKPIPLLLCKNPGIPCNDNLDDDDDDGDAPYDVDGSTYKNHPFTFFCLGLYP
jgi:hypothetical protein